MSEVLEEQNSKPFNLDHVLGIVRRRHMQFLVPFFFGWLAVWGASWIVPARYKSATLILVQQPTMPQNYVTPNISDDMQQQLESMTQQILSRTRLLLIIDKFHLYGANNDQVSSDAKVEAMRKDINIELVRDPRREEITSFRITYTAKDPHLAQLVSGELTNLFISENLKERAQESEGTTDFIRQQLEAARQSLSEQEEKVKQFEGTHEGDLPTQQTSNLQILSGLQSQLQNEQDALNTSKQQRVYLQAMIAEERSSPTRTVTNSAGTVTGPADLEQLDAQLDKMRAQLTELSSRYTDKYPDVLNLKTQIAKTEAQRQALAASEKKNSESAAQGNSTETSGSAALRQLQGQLQSNQLEITNRESSIAQLQGRINDYQGRLNAEPGTEQQLADLTRGYDQSKANYDDLLKKRDESQMATSLEQKQQGERFSVLDPPTLPLQPSFPNRLIFCGAGLGLGLVLGSLVAGGFELLDGRMYDEDELKNALPIAVLSEIPEIVSPMDQEDAKRNNTLRWTATGLAFAIILACAALSYFRG